MTPDIRSRLTDIISRGLVSGTGSNTPGDTCVEVAIALACGLAPTDNPSSCVAPEDRAYSITLNDALWSSPQARAQGMLPLALAQLGTAGTDRSEWVRRVVEGTIRRVLPVALRRAADVHPDDRHRAALREAADRCEREGSHATAAAASANASHAASHATAAAASANASHAASHAAAAAASANASHAASHAAAAAANAAATAAAVSSYATAYASARADEILLIAGDVAVQAYREAA